MLHLITGQNGAGKSLRAIELMYKRHGEGMEVYAFGFRGLKVPFVKQFADPRKWRDLPSNAVLFVDEAQQVWRTRLAGGLYRLKCWIWKRIGIRASTFT